MVVVSDQVAAKDSFVPFKVKQITCWSQFAVGQPDAYKITVLMITPWDCLWNTLMLCLGIIHITEHLQVRI